ncbi:MAG: 50S ribosomal protein L11 methyltransferase, partial [Oscillospiraceae bacterium]|nr:50S ribosomal protein L11 methyltransferase [Oscillospiraceae bacterium]
EYNGIVNLPAAKEKDVDLGKIKFTGTHNGVTDSYFGGNVIVKKKPAPSSSAKPNSSNSSTNSGGYIPVGNKLMVVPEWEDTDCEGRLPLRLDPGLIFGTGSHATTKMCLAALEEHACPGKKFLDLGCGSGILGIGALVLGADSCIGCDIDPKAPDVAMSNAALNGIGAERFKVYAGDIIGDASLRRFMGSGYDVVLANIVSDVIIPLSAYVHDFLKPGGIFICSGIIDGRQDEVRAAIEQNGFKITAHHQLEEWHCFVCE